MSTKLFFVATLAISVALVPRLEAQVQTEVPPVVPGAKPVTVEHIKIHGEALEGNLEGDAVDRDVIVFLPPSYTKEKHRRYPVVYALHGYSIGAEQWTREIHVPQTIEGAFAKGSQEMIVVLPDSKTVYGGSMYSSSVTTGDFERFIADDVVAYIDAHYRTIPKRMGRGLVGHSMGGYGAARIGMKHPDVFGSLYIMSPCCLSPMGSRPAIPAMQKAMEEQDKALESVKTPADAAGLSFFVRAQLASAAAWSPDPKNPLLYLDLPRKDGVPQPDVLTKWAANAPLAFVDQYIGNLRQYRAIAIDGGDKDGLRIDAGKLHDVLDTYGIANSFEVYEGTHTSKVADRFQNHVIPFFSRNLCFQKDCRYPLIAAQQEVSHSGWIEFRSFEYRGEDSLAQPAKPKADEYRNPILSGFYPDPSIVRVGEDFYLVNSSFSWYPGVPIFHSRDLVDWEQIGHVLDRPEQLPLSGVGVSRGIFAPTIRYHNGQYYMITTNVDGTGNFYVTAKNPAGPWSNPTLLPEIAGIDPSFFFDDDGKAYIVHNGLPPDNKPLYSGHRALYLFPFDVNSGKVSGPGKIIVNGGTDLSKKPTWIEGPHIFKRNGFYYLIAAEGGTAEEHSEVVFRSRSVDGPYESYRGNPILTQRTLSPSRPDPITSTGHADFVETQNGEWWAVFLGCEPYEDDFYNTGRETFLLPVKWVDGWPVILDANKMVPHVVRRPKLSIQDAATQPMTGPFQWTADFSGKQLPYSLNTLRTPTSRWWNMDAKQPALFLEPRPEDLDSKRDPSLMARRQQHANFSSTVQVRFRDTDKPSDAGLITLQNETHSFFLGIHVSPQGQRTVFLERRNDDVAQVASVSLPAGAHDVTLKVAGAGERCRFYYRVATEDWMQIGGDQDGTILSTKKAGGFVGTYVGLFARTSPVSHAVVP
ncbi:MAG: alpha/beta fold hydrolase [Terriglobia bacterium]